MGSKAPRRAERAGSRHPRKTLPAGERRPSSRSVPYSSVIIAGRPEELEAALPFFFEHGCLGTVDRDSSHQAFFPPGADLKTRVAEWGGRFPHLRFSPPAPVRDRPWDEAFRRGFRGFPIGRRFRVQPTWEEAQPRKREVLWLNPSRAFGTGTHATTQLALECLEDYLVSGASLIDVGTGTGILAMAAARLGAMPVLAIDCDPDAVFCARENVVRNQLAGRVEIRQANLRRFRPAPARAVVANLSEPLLRDTLRRIASWVDSPGFLIASGFLCEQAQTLVERTPGGMVLLEERIRGEWAALVWRKG